MTRILFVLASLLLLGGCSVTRFEAPLGAALDTCDPRWKGLWIGEEKSSTPDEPSDAAGVFVDEQCRFFLLDQDGKGGPLKQIHVPANFTRLGRNDYLVFSDVALKSVEQFGPVPGMEEQPEKTFLFFRYRVKGDRIEVFDIDNERVAHLILDEKIKGHLLKTGSHLENFVRGDAAAMAKIIEDHDLFQRKPMVLLRHRDQTPEQYEHEISGTSLKAKK